MDATEIKVGRLTGAQGVVAVLAAVPDLVVLGLPGGNMMMVVDELAAHPAPPKTILTREESVASVMAEALGRVTGKPAVVIGQGAWFLGLAGIGIMEAQLSSTPMVILVDATEGGGFSHHGAYQTGLGDYGGIDVVNGLRAITKRTFLALDPTQAAQMTQLAFKHATSGEPGPVAVVFHERALRDVVTERAGPRLHLDRDYVIPRNAAPGPEQLDAAVAAIRQSERPVIIAGNGVRAGGAEAALLRFSGQCRIPTATTPAGKGVFPEDDPLAVGVIGRFGHAVANDVVAGADLIIAIGTKLSATDTFKSSKQFIDPDRQTIIQLDIEPLNAGWTYPLDVALIGDVKPALAALSADLGDFSANGDGRVREARLSHPYFPALEPAPDLRARRAIQILSEELPADAVVVSDAGENRLFLVHDYQVKAGGSLLQPSGGGGMGYAVPAASAVAVATSRPAVAVCGDGGFSMSFEAVLTAVENRLPVLIVVLDNAALGWVLHAQVRPFMSSLHRFNLAEIAAAMECDVGVAADEDSFRAALRDKVGRGGVRVVVARISMADSYLDVHKRLSRGEP
jgi:acetolactate synthase-1/2/3 large subunit